MKLTDEIKIPKERVGSRFVLLGAAFLIYFAAACTDSSFCFIYIVMFVYFFILIVVGAVIVHQVNRIEFHLKELRERRINSK